MIPITKWNETLAWNGRVCLSEQPAVTDQLGDARAGGAQGFEFREDGVFERTEFGEETIADGILHQVAEFLHRVEFRGVGRQRKRSPEYLIGRRQI